MFSLVKNLYCMVVLYLIKDHCKLSTVLFIPVVVKFSLCSIEVKSRAITVVRTTPSHTDYYNHVGNVKLVNAN